MIEYINQNTDEAATILGESYALSVTETKKYINWPGMRYTMEIRGLDEFISFMQEANYINFENIELADILWEVGLYEKQ